MYLRFAIIALAGICAVVPITFPDWALTYSYYYYKPTVITASVSAITPTSAVGGGNVTSDGGVPVTVRGVCWNVSPNPTVAESKTIDGSGVGAFTSSLRGLSPNTTYYVRAYATNEEGTDYGINRSFTTRSTEATIPTLSKWGMLIVSLLILLVAVVAFCRFKRIPF